MIAVPTISLVKISRMSRNKSKVHKPSTIHAIVLIYKPLLSICVGLLYTLKSVDAKAVLPQ